MLCPKTEGGYFASKICPKSKKIVILNDYLEPLVKQNNLYSRILRMINSIKTKTLHIRIRQTDKQTVRQAGLSNILYAVRLSKYTKAAWPRGLRRWT